MAQKTWDEETCERILNDGDTLGCYYDAFAPDDTFGWGRLFQQMWFSSYDAQPSGTGVLLTGPAGCGKHTAAAHLIRNLRSRGYELAVLPEDDPEEDGLLTPTRDRLNSLLDYCLEKVKAPLCLLAEDLSRRSRSRELGRFLGEMLCLYSLHRGGGSLRPGPKDPREFSAEEEPMLPLFLILIEGREEAVPGILRSRLQLCRMSPPDRTLREQFMSSHNVLCVNDYKLLDREEFLKRTEGMTYAQLEDLVNSLNTLVQGNKKADADAVLTLLESQLPPARSQGRLERVLRELPGMLSRLQLNVGSGVVVQQPAGAVVQETKPEEDHMTESDYVSMFEKDSVYASAVDVLDADYVEAHIAKHNLQVDRS